MGQCQVNGRARLRPQVCHIMEAGASQMSGSQTRQTDGAWFGESIKAVTLSNRRCTRGLEVTEVPAAS